MYLRGIGTDKHGFILKRDVSVLEISTRENQFFCPFRSVFYFFYLTFAIFVPFVAIYLFFFSPFR